MKMNSRLIGLPVEQPPTLAAKLHTTAESAVEDLIARYQTATDFLRDQFGVVMDSGTAKARYRAFYPQVSLETSSYAKVDSRLSYGHVAGPL